MTATQQIPIEGIDRLTLDFAVVDLSVEWVDDADAIVVTGRELPVEQAAGEVFIRADLGDEEDAGESALSVSIPVALPRCTLEVEQGQLNITNPRGVVECRVQEGDIVLHGGEAEINLTAGSGAVNVSRLRGSILLIGGSGDISLSELAAATTIRAGSGQILLDRITADEIKIAAGSGGIAVRDCVADVFLLEAGSGDVEVSSGRLGQITVRTGSGGIDCRTVFGSQLQSFASGSGSISVAIPRDLPARVEATTNRGNIESEIPLVSVSQRGPRSRRTRRQVGSIGTGEPRAEVSIRTSSGDVRLSWLDESVRAESAEGARSGRESDSDRSVELEILNALSREEISVDEADILLRRARSAIDKAG